MKFVCLALIAFYQRFISPRKGFCCAHHQLHKGPTCSNAVKFIIRENSWAGSLPLIKARFEACKRASKTLASQRVGTNHKADLPCDCAFELPNFGDASPCSGDQPCDLCLDWPNMKRRTRRIVIAFVLIGAAIAAYFYGSQITKIEIAQVEASERNDGLLQKLISREEPSLRALVIIDGRKIYSEIKTIDQLNDGEPLTVELDEAISIKNVSMLELHDARFSAAAEIIVLGQVLETFEQPKDKDQGKRFAYKFKSRWGF